MPENLGSLQTPEGNDIAKIYQIVNGELSMSDQQLAIQSHEFNKLYDQTDAMQIKDKVLVIPTIHNNREIWCAVCPAAAQVALIWKTHSLAHSGPRQTLVCIRLQWYWPGMTHI